MRRSRRIPVAPAHPWSPETIERTRRLLARAGRPDGEQEALDLLATIRGPGLRLLRTLAEHGLPSPLDPCED